jgi:non-ribosomal peptide synthetase-like protein
VGAGARVGARTVLMPGAEVGAGAEVEPGSVVTGEIPAGERWEGSPARRVGAAGEGWPRGAPPRPAHRLGWRSMYALGLAVEAALPLVAALPTFGALLLIGSAYAGAERLAITMITLAVPITAWFIVTYALLVAALFRATSRLLQPGVHSDEGGAAWALWFSQSLLDGAMGVMFPIYSSVYTRPWLRLLGIRVGKRTEMSHAVTLNQLTRIGETSFAADDVGFITGRTRGGWLALAPIEVGNRTFLGNGAIAQGATRLGDDSLVGVLTVSPPASSDGTSWFGAPALELQRIPDRPDPARTTNPSRRLVAARGATELVRIVVPSSVAVVLGALVFWALTTLGAAAGAWVMILAAPFMLLAAGVVATALTVAAKWLVIGRYRPSEHPFWSFFVWRDEIMNTCQEALAGAWLMNLALGTPLMSVYLRAMGAKVGRGVWCETLNITEYDVVELGDGSAVNRSAHVETHLVHDRLLRIGPTTLEPGSTLGPHSAVLPDTRLGAGTTVGGRSVVMRGEELPAGTRWHGAPVVAAPVIATPAAQAPAVQRPAALVAGLAGLGEQVPRSAALAS